MYATEKFHWSYNRDKWSHNPWNWLGSIGYNETTRGVKRKGRFGPLSNKKMNWNSIRLADYMARRHPEEFIVWKAKQRLRVK